jgi:hypothetical protein
MHAREDLLNTDHITMSGVPNLGSDRAKTTGIRVLSRTQPGFTIAATTGGSTLVLPWER